MANWLELFMKLHIHIAKVHYTVRTEVAKTWKGLNVDFEYILFSKVTRTILKSAFLVPYGIGGRGIVHEL